MVLALYIGIAWLVVAILITIPKKLSVRHNLFLFLTLVIIIINFFTIVITKLELVGISDNKLMAISGLIYRDIITTFTVIISINLYHLSNSFKIKIVILLLTVFILTVLTILSAKVGIYDFKNWGNIHSFLSYVFFQLIGLSLSKLFEWIQKKEEAWN